MPSPGSPGIINVGNKGGIITGGLGRPACQGMITNLPFQLGCFIVVPPPIVAPGQEGGSIPLHPGEIQNFYQPVDYQPLDTDAEGNFVDPRVYGKQKVKVTFQSKFLENEKEFLVPMKRMNTVFKVLNVMNRTTERMNLALKGIRNIASRAIVIVKNIRKRR